MIKHNYKFIKTLSLLFLSIFISSCSLIDGSNKEDKTSDNSSKEETSNESSENQNTSNEDVGQETNDSDNESNQEANNSNEESNSNNENNEQNENSSNDSSNESIDAYMYYGNYPQKEIVSVASDSGVYNKSWSSENDYIIDASLYNSLNSLEETNWDNNGDTTFNNTKYRRLKSSDALSVEDDSDNYYLWGSNDTYHYFKYEPIKWRILDQTSDDIFLISDIAIDNQMYNTKITNMTWENSTIRSYLNGYDGSSNVYNIDYTSSNFINTAFSSEEQSKIKSSTIVNNDNTKSGTEGGNDTIDKIYMLSEDESYGDNATKYGFNSSYDNHDLARQFKSSTYAKALGCYSDSETDTLGNCYWWLRSPGSYTGLFILVRPNGSIYRGGQHANSKTRGVVPCMHISK